VEGRAGTLGRALIGGARMRHAARLVKQASDSSEPRAEPVPQLEPFEASFRKGNFARLHQQLISQDQAATTASARLRALAAATAIDPVHVAVLALGVIALIGITLRYLG